MVMAYTYQCLFKKIVVIKHFKNWLPFWVLPILFLYFHWPIFLKTLIFCADSAILRGSWQKLLNGNIRSKQKIRHPNLPWTQVSQGQRKLHVLMVVSRTTWWLGTFQEFLIQIRIKLIHLRSVWTLPWFCGLLPASCWGTPWTIIGHLLSDQHYSTRIRGPSCHWKILEVWYGKQKKRQNISS